MKFSSSFVGAEIQEVCINSVNRRVEIVTTMGLLEVVPCSDGIVEVRTNGRLLASIPENIEVCRD